MKRFQTRSNWECKKKMKQVGHIKGLLTQKERLRNEKTPPFSVPKTEALDSNPGWEL
jgi:hypothetical protein